jgi:hypothetical protein
LLTTPGVLHFVGIGPIPIPIDEEEIAALQAAGRSGLAVEPWPYVEIGQKVRLEDGPLRGLEGICVGHSKQQVIVSVTLLRRSIAITVEREWVQSIYAAASANRLITGVTGNQSSRLIGASADSRRLPLGNPRKVKGDRN